MSVTMQNTLPLPRRRPLGLRARAAWFVVGGCGAFWTSLIGLTVLAVAR